MRTRLCGEDALSVGAGLEELPLGGLSPADFKLAFRNHPAGVAVSTGDAGDGPVGLTATSVFLVSVVAVHALEAEITADATASAPHVYHNRTWHHPGEHSTITT